MAEAGNWCLIESDPGVFTELVRGFGVTGAQIEELYSLESEQFSQLKPVHGLIFLFKWRPGEQPSGTVSNNEKIFFAGQIIQNACATIAIINLLLNLPSDSGIKLGKILEDFQNFTQDFDQMHRGLCLTSCEAIRDVHNSFARQHLFELDIKSTSKDDDYHFVTYMPIDGHIYELDGLRQGPIDLGAINEGEDWIDTVRPIISNRIQRYSENEIHFNLLAVISDRKMKYEKRLQELLEFGMESEENAKEIVELETNIAMEEEKSRKYKIENIRRRHNYMPFIVELLKILAKENKLVHLVEQTKLLDKSEQREALETIK
ncbi:unnamed protein product [Dracunculus medinensis]|uniref:Ubiquitin carboxyl-terminal hydrolase n=1 Tax=Dracunculus medinensis TaxID=318479 RepID=A0A0N4UJ77_DRAME|nr:unnamed protein product [Dracunculus medinensis]